MMSIAVLPAEWEPTRATLQRYAHAVTALPRAGAPSHPRWAQVAMEVAPQGLVSAATPLEDGTRLVSTIDLEKHQIVISAGDTSRVFDLTEGPAPKAVGQSVAAIAAEHGSTFDVDASRYEDDSLQEYDASHASAFLDVATTVGDAFARINAGISGEITGPHLWPHGFDIATEWYSEKLVDYEGTPTSAQIAIGWYPAGDAYFYANPWPFEESWADVELPGGASWNTDGWYGALLSVADIDEGSGEESVVALGEAVHATARNALSG
ncbi:MAG: DUF5996 family protein [Actinomycetota bacterium]